MNGIQGVNGVKNMRAERTKKVFSDILSVVGPLASLAGPIGGAIGGLASAGASRLQPTESPADNFAVAAYGGKVEVEGNETMKLPNGGMMDFTGKPSHAQGGHKMIAPNNAFVFSNRIGYKDKLSFADFSRKMNRKYTDRSALKEATLKVAQADNTKAAKNLSNAAVMAYGGKVKKMEVGGPIQPVPFMDYGWREMMGRQGADPNIYPNDPAKFNHLGWGAIGTTTPQLEAARRAELNRLLTTEANALDRELGVPEVPSVQYPKIPSPTTSLTGPPAMDFTGVSEPTTPAGGNASVQPGFGDYEGIDIDPNALAKDILSDTPEQQTRDLSVTSDEYSDQGFVVNSGGLAGQLLPKLPSIAYNIAQGILPAEKESFQRNENESEIKRLLDQRVSLDPVRQQINMQNNIARSVNRNAPTGAVVAARNAQANAQALRALGQLSLQQQQINNQLDAQEANVLNQLGEQNRGERRRVSEINAQNRGARQRSLTTGLSQISDVGTQIAGKRMNDYNNAINLAFLSAKYPDFNIQNFMNQMGRKKVITTDDVLRFR